MGNLFSSLMIGCIGTGYFMYGKKAGRMYPLFAGILMFIYPYFIPNVWAMWGICVAIMVACYMLRDQ